MVRVPGPGRFELRLPDGAVNPYLLQAVVIAAGLNGLKTKADPGKRYDNDMYAQPERAADAPGLPLNMLDALRTFDKDTSRVTSRRRILGRLPEAEIRRMERLRVPPHSMGAETIRSTFKPEYGRGRRVNRKGTFRWLH